MKAETYRRKAVELREKAAKTNSRFWKKIEGMEAEADRLERRAEEKEEYERSLATEDDDDDDDEWDADDDDECDDDEYEDDDESADDEDAEDDDAEDEDEDAREEDVRDYFSDHTEPFVEKAVEIAAQGNYIFLNEIIGDVYRELDGDETMDDICYFLGLCDEANEFMREEFFSCFEPWNYQWFFDYVQIYDDAFHKGIEHYHDEDKAKEFAESCARGGEIPDFEDEFEECVRNNEPWLCISAEGNGPFSENEEYDADFIISCYYEWNEYGGGSDDEIYLNGEYGNYSFIPAASAEESDDEEDEDANVPF